jgi:hypothetical protein
MVSGSRACLTFILSDHPHWPSRHFDGALGSPHPLTFSRLRYGPAMTPDYRPSLLRSFERHLRAENRSDQTVATYLIALRQAEAFLTAARGTTSPRPAGPTWRPT